MKRTIGLILGLFTLLIVGGEIKANEFFPSDEVARIYTKLGEEVYSNGKCKMYQLHYYDDNGSPYNPKDDIYLGSDWVVDCPE